MSRKNVPITAILLAIMAVLFAAPNARAATSYAEMTRHLRFDCATQPGRLHLYTIGAAAKSQRPLWLVRVSAQDASTDLSTSPRILIICRQHGDEPVSTEAALRFVHEVAQAPKSRLSDLLGDVTLYIVPMANPDGADALQRLNGVGADLNRDWAANRLTQPETRAIYGAYRRIKPQVVVDLHSWTATDSFQANSVEVIRAGDTPNSAASGEAARLQSAAIEAAGGCGQRMSAFTYSKYCDQSLCHRFFASQPGVVSLLVETAAGGVTGDAMATRIGIDDAVIRTLVLRLQADLPTWRRIAPKLALTAPTSAYTASLDTLNRAAGIAVAPPPVSPAVRRAQLHAVLQRRMRVAEPWSLLLYALACCVILRAFWPNVRQSLSLIFARFSRQRQVDTGYLSIRERHFPGSPVKGFSCYSTRRVASRRSA